jgi:hypothetical protein
MLMAFRIYVPFAILVCMASALYLGGWFILGPTILGTIVLIVGYLQTLNRNPMGAFLGVLAGIFWVLCFSILMVRDFSLPALAMGFSAVLLVPVCVMAVLELGPKTSESQDPV